MNPLMITASALVIGAIFASAALARDTVQISGSSTVLPYATIVAESFGENFDFPTPVVEGGASGAGRKKLCEGVADKTIDIANSSSRIKQSDIDLCAQNGVTGIIEVRTGHDGIVFASDLNRAEFAFTPDDWYNALVANPNKTWADVNPALPAQDILAFIPGTNHGTREVFDIKVLEAGCQAIDVFGLSVYQNNTDKLRVAPMSGILPSVETIASGAYPVSRPLYFCVKIQHLDVIPGLQEYIDFFVSHDMTGPNDPLTAYGLVSDPDLAKTQEMVARTPKGPLIPGIAAIGSALAGMALSICRITRDQRARNSVEDIIKAMLFGCSLIALATFFGIAASLLFESIHFFQLYPAADFFLSPTWNPRFGGGSALGLWPLLWGTLYVSVIALPVAVPTGLMAAIHLSEYASRRTRAVA